MLRVMLIGVASELGLAMGCFAIRGCWHSQGAARLLVPHVDQLTARSPAVNGRCAAKGAAASATFCRSSFLNCAAGQQQFA